MSAEENGHQCVLEDRMTKCENRICDLDKLQALQTLSFQNIEKSVLKMESSLTWGVRIVLGLVFAGAIKIMMK